MASIFKEFLYEGDETRHMKECTLIYVELQNDRDTKSKVSSCHVRVTQFYIMSSEERGFIFCWGG